MSGSGTEKGAVSAQTVDNTTRPDSESAAMKPKRNKFAFVCAILASLTSILLGYDIGVMSGALIYIKDDLKISEVQVEILGGILNLYCLVGSFAAGRISDWIGRRCIIVIANAIFFAGSLLMGFSTNYAFLMVSRFVAGLGAGFAIMIAPVYTAELSPATSRGFLTSLTEVSVNFGILLGYVSNYGFSKLPTNLGWRFMLGVGAVPAVFLAMTALALPESPRWLVMQGRLGEAKRVLHKTLNTEEEVELRLRDIKEAVGIPDDCKDDVVQVPKQSHGEGVWKELLLHPTPAVRHVLICAIGLHVIHQSSGIDAVVLYSPRIFEKAGITSYNYKLLATVAVGFVKTTFILVATFFLDRIGRRPLILTSVGGMVASLVMLGFSLTMIDHSEEKLTWAIGLCIAMVLAFVAFFSIGLGPMAPVYTSEIFPLRLRAQGVSMGVAVNRVTSGVTSMTFISLYEAITIGGAFFLYAGLAAMGWLFFYTFLPETRGRTLEEIEGLFGKLVGWREESKKMKMKMKRMEVNGDGKSNNQIQLGTTTTTDSNI